MAKRNSNDAAPHGNPTTPIPEGLLYTREQLEFGMKPGLRPLIPAWHLVGGVIKMTYWHAVKYYSHTLIHAERARMACTFAEAREWVEGYHHFRNRRLEEVLKWLLEAYPPFIQDIDTRFPQYRPWELVRNRTSECPFPPILEEVGHGKVMPHAMEEPIIRPYVIPSTDRILKKECLTDIMLGEPGPFFDYLRQEVVDTFEALQKLRVQMETGTVHNQCQLEEIWRRHKPMHDDLLAWLIKNDPQQ